LGNKKPRKAVYKFGGGGKKESANGLFGQAPSVGTKGEKKLGRGKKIRANARASR